MILSASLIATVVA
jgi:hypothetical protein